MRVIRSDSFKVDFARLPRHLQRSTEKALRLLLQNPRHASLHTKRMQGKKGKEIWEARVSQGYRITFEIGEDAYLLRRVGSHDILRNP
jgi:mRNA interferase RelE/StbE